MPTKPPTKHPTKLPTKAPIKQCTSSTDIVNYINSITLSGRPLTLTGATPLDLALKQLVESNNGALSTCLTEDANRLRQRYAYLAWVFSAGKGNFKSWFDAANECSWTGITCSGSTVTALDHSGQVLTGTIPADVGLWTSLISFDVGGNQLMGSLPSSIGKWTSLTLFIVSSNSLKGSLPSSIGLWTSISLFSVSNNQLTGNVPNEVSGWKSIFGAYFYNNLFGGTMPGINVGNFCPRKNTNTGYLFADCKAPAKIVCDCCSRCY
jgi:Leucine rich repeat N-terminal domain